MKQRLLFVMISIMLGLGTAGLVWAISETEPNDSPAEANALASGQRMEGAIGPVGDVDYYAQNGVNVTWGYIALLETISSTSSQEATLTALGSDGTTVLQSDSGSWERGSGLALQNYADGGSIHYLRVNEDGDDATVSTYTLRYYSTVVNTQPEVEPNDTVTNATLSAFTHAGTLTTSSDVDCFAFYALADDVILLAMNGDPEGDGSPVDGVLELVDGTGTVLDTADVSGMAGSEFIEYAGLPGDGTYAYCVRVGAGTAGVAATYTAGLVRNGGLYTPNYKLQATWLNPPPNNVAHISDTLSFRLAITNTGTLTIPGDIDQLASFDPNCLNFLDADPAPSAVSSDEVEWIGMQSGLAPGELYTITVNFEAAGGCNDKVHQSTVINYFFTGSGTDAFYTIHSEFVYLPFVIRP